MSRSPGEEAAPWEGGQGFWPGTTTSSPFDLALSVWSWAQPLSPADSRQRLLQFLYVCVCVTDRAPGSLIPLLLLENKAHLHCTGSSSGESKGCEASSQCQAHCSCSINVSCCCCLTSGNLVCPEAKLSPKGASWLQRSLQPACCRTAPVYISHACPFSLQRQPLLALPAAKLPPSLPLRVVPSYLAATLGPSSNTAPWEQQSMGRNSLPDR